ncbi:phosphoglucomutase/phosphomannomutase PgmG [Pseudomonadota bacterium]
MKNMTKSKGYNFHDSILRAYDIRGIFGQTLAAKDAYFLGKSFVKFCSELNKKKKKLKIVIGYDGRKSSLKLSEALIKGLMESGVNVINMGLCPTPMLYFGVKYFESDAGIMITGSHNPPEYNGFKLLLKDRPIFGDDIQKIGQIAKEGEFLNASGNVREENIKLEYIKRITKDFKPGRKLKVAWDCGNGVTGVVMPMLANYLPTVDSLLLYEHVDANFPNHHPDPTIEENLEDLKKAVIRNKCDVGFAFDGDGDRIGVVDSKGEVIWGDQLMMLYAEEILSKYPGATIISEVKASQHLFDRIEELGGNPIMFRTGHSYIKAKMKEVKALFAGEMSGHMFFADIYDGFDDGLYAAIRVLNIIGNKDKKLYEFRKSLPKSFATPELRIEVDDDKKFEIVEEIKHRLKELHTDLNDIDGVRVNTEQGWFLIRASNTQPILIARCEADNKNDLKILKENLRDQLKLSGIEFKC